MMNLMDNNNPDVTIKHLNELESYKGEGQFNYAAKSLGVTAWGMNLLKLPPNWQDYPDHDHEHDAQEEVYVVLEGGAVLRAGEKSWELTPGTMVRVGAGQKRKITPGNEGVMILAIGGTPEKAYEPRR